MTVTKSSPSPTPSGAGIPSPNAASGAQHFATTGTTGAGTPQVWMPVTPAKGKQNNQFMTEQGQANQQLRKTGTFMSLDEATGTYYTWTTQQRDSFRAKALLAGLLQRGDGDMEAGALWSKLVTQAGNYGAQGQQVSPLDLLAGYVKANASGGNWIKQGDFEVNPLTGEKRYVGPQFKTTTASNVDLTDPATARAIATQIFQQSLGRDPGQGEINGFANALSQSEQSNPSQTTTTTQYDMKTGDPTNTASVTQGGMSDDARALLARDEIEKKPEYGAFQAATTYQNALNAAVGVK